MAKKEFSFRGKSLQELQEMDIAEFAKLLTSRARRTVLRGIDKTFMKTLEEAVKEKKEGKEPEIIKTHARDIIVLPSMVGLRFGIYNGKEFKPIQVSERMIGHFFGELSLTRGRLSHGKAGIGATKSSTAITARK